MKWILVGIAGAVAVAALAWSVPGVRRAVELRAVEAVGEIATARLEASGDSERSADFINIPVEVRQIRDNIFQARGVGNTHLIATSEGHVVFDTGLGIQAPKQMRLLKEAAPEGPITHIVVSHSHADHAGGVAFWLEEGIEVVAHWEFSEEQRYLKELEPYFYGRNRMLFPFMPEEPPQSGPLATGGVRPTRLVANGETYRFEQGGVRFEVLATPGAEGSDNIVLWLPDEKILFSGDFFGPLFPQFPNVFTMRGEKVRKPIEYIRSLEQVIALEPETIVPSHLDPVSGKDEIAEALVRTRDAVRYVHDRTVEGMNAGKSVYELMAEIELPPELELTQAHGRVSWAVKSIWEYYSTWFHFDRTTELYEVPAWEVWPEVVELAGAEALVAKARAHLEAGRPVHALHLLEIVLGMDGADPGALEARRDALSVLLERAETGLRNSYEIDWLKFRLRDTAERLERADG